MATTIRPTPTWWSLVTAFSLIYREFPANYVIRTTSPLGLGDELRALRGLKRDAKSPFIFVSERGAPFTVSGLQKMIERAGIEASCPSSATRTCCATQPVTS
jgi:hypothetical protein